jgi:hypothetical protein
MSVVFKTTVNSPSTHVVDCDAGDTFVTRASVHNGEAVTAVPIDQQALLNALGDAMGMLAAEERKEREQQVSELREKTAALEGKVEVLLSLIQGKGQIIDLPALPRSESSSEKMIRKIRVTR